MPTLALKSKFSIGTSSATPATDTYTPILGITDIGDFGDEAEIVKIQTIDSDRADKMKGARDAGTFEFTVAREMSDLGQIALRVAANGNAKYNLRIEADDKPTGANTKPTTIYLRGLVQVKNGFGSANDFTKQTFVFELTDAPVTMPAA